MHTVRRQAHRVASQHGGNGAANYNPFARQRSRDINLDEENAVYRTRSETHATPAIEEQRRLESREAGKEFGMPDHHNTEPSASSPTYGSASTTFPESTTEKDLTSHLNGTHKASDDSTIVPSNQESNVGPTRRARFKGIFRKDHQDAENDEAEHPEADELSLEERKKKAFKRKIPVGAQIKFVLFGAWINVLLVMVPVGFAVYYARLKPVPVFIINFIAIVPLASLLSFATEELSAKLGQTIGGLMNATFGNAVELIVSIVALRQGEIRIVQSSMLGSILSNILLVLGCCFIASGVRRTESRFNETVASTMASLMAVAATSLIIPATLYASLKGSAADSEDNILILSHGTAIIMLILYCLYLFFQLKSHAHLFDAEQQQEGGDEESDEPQILNPIAATICLILVTVLVAVCAEYLVDSIDAIVDSLHISKTFIGLILLPIVGNAAEHVTACVVAYKDKMDLAIGVAIGSSMQIALFVTPFLVILGWIMGQPMTLHFQGFETVVFFLSVLVVNYLIGDGKSNYLEGCMCLGTYIIIALAFYVYPDDATDIGAMVKGVFAN